MLYAAIIGRNYFFDENHSLEIGRFEMVWYDPGFAEFGNKISAPVINGPAKGAAETGD